MNSIYCRVVTSFHRLHRSMNTTDDFLQHLRIIDHYPLGRTTAEDAKHSISRIRKLCDTHGYETLVSNNGASTLLNLIRNEEVHKSVQLDSFLMFVHLTNDGQLVRNLLEADYGIDPFLKHLNNEDIRLKAASCLVLGNMTLDPLNVPKVCSDDAIDTIVNQMDFPHEGIQRAAISCIANIASNSKGSSYLRERHAIPRLVNFLEPSNPIKLRSIAASALGNLLSSRDIAVQDEVREHGGLANLVLLMSMVYPEEAHEGSTWALSLAIHNNFQNQIFVGKSGGIGMLVALLDSSNDSVRRNAIRALCDSINGCVSNIEVLTRNPASMEKLDQMHKLDSLPECREHAGILLDSIMKDSDN